MNPTDVLEVREIHTNGQRIFKVVREKKEYTICRHPRYDFFRVDPYPSKEELRDIYLEFENPAPTFHAYKYHDLLQNRLKLIGEDRWKITEIGCGSGELLAVFRDYGHQTFGFEPGRRDGECCRRLGLDVAEVFFEDRLLKDRGKQDLIILVGILEHVPYPDDFLRGLTGHLCEGTGYLLVQVPNEFNPFQEQFFKNTNRSYTFLCPPYHLNYFSPEGMEALLEDCGYEVVHRTCEFPMEMFLLSGRSYLGEPAVGKQCHQERLAFEQSLRSNMGLLWDFYDALARINLGRDVIIVAKLRNP